KHEPIWRRYLRFWGPAPARDVDDEFEFHIQSKVDELTAAGLPPDEARQEALRRFGPRGSVWEECYMISKRQVDSQSRIEYFAGWWRDLMYAARVLRKAK